MVEKIEKDKQRAEVFDALGHPMRLRILKTLSEGPLGFAELKRSLNIESSGHLKHHLDKLNELIRTDDYGKYCISDKGKDALLTMQPIEKYNEDARFREQAGLLIRALRSDLNSVQ
jgi:DNA-binding HxlR family transcriptional regulator